MAENLRIYFCGSIRGGREDWALYARLIGSLREFGEVLTEHIGEPELEVAGEADLSDEEIYDRDVQWLRSADVIVAEVSTPSLGVGWEVARAESDGKPVLCLHRERPGRPLSAMLAGNPNLVVRTYESLDEARTCVAEFLAKVKSEGARSVE